MFHMNIDETNFIFDLNFHFIDFGFKSIKSFIHFIQFS